MKAARLVFAGIVTLAATCSTAQTLVERSYVLRAETTTFEQYSGMERTCVLIYPDGRYRMEKTFQGLQGGDPETKVYLDTLPDADMKALQLVLDDGKFQEIKTPQAHGGIIKDMDTLYVTIPREHLMQNMSFNNAADRKPFEKALKPFQNSLKNIEKRKVPVAKSEKSNNCEPPRVIYRSTFAPSSNGENPQP
jgi:hypothetical protein